MVESRQGERDEGEERVSRVPQLGRSSVRFTSVCTRTLISSSLLPAQQRVRTVKFCPQSLQSNLPTLFLLSLPPHQLHPPPYYGHSHLARYRPRMLAEETPEGLVCARRGVSWSQVRRGDGPRGAILALPPPGLRVDFFRFPIVGLRALG